MNDDPKLTAYALGELTDPADVAEAEAALRQSPAARAELEAIQSFAAMLVAEYDGERDILPANVIALPRASSRIAPVLWSMAAAVAVLATVVGVTFRSAQAPAFKATKPAVLPSLATAAKELPSSAVASQEAPAPAPLTSPAAPNVVDLASAKSRPETLTMGGSLASSATAPARDVWEAAKGWERPIRRFGVDALALKELTASPSGATAQVASPNVVNQSLFALRKDKDGRTRQEFAGYFNYGSPIQPVPATDAPAQEPAVTAGNRGGTFQPAPVVGDVPQVSRLFRSKITPDTAHYEHRPENAFLPVKDNPLSTFSADVDTASYSNVRRFIEQGSLPPPDAVRIEEMLNYFPFSDAPPAADNPRPFAIRLEAAACPWAPEHRLVRIGIKGREMAADKRPASNLVFLIDVSGSMTPPERLPLIKESLRQMVDKLGDNDRVGIVVYAGESGVALPSTTGDHKEVILAALAGLHAGGSTNGAAGITLAYQIAQEHFIKGGVNRVILATDGDFNVGVTSRAELVSKIEREAKGGVFLSVLGVGTNNLKDSTMQMLADHGNGNYAYLDSLAEGKKVLVEQMSGTLVTIAKDVKIQVEFNPGLVSAYRLIGYEKRALRPEDFNNDKIDAGEIGAGHSVVALYEVVPAGQPAPGATPALDPLKYQGAPAPSAEAPVIKTVSPSPELLTVKLRHKAPDGDRSERSYEEPLVDRGAPGDYGKASADFKFSAAVAGFGMLLSDSAYKGSTTFDSVAELAQEGKGADASGYRAGFIELVRRARALRQGAGDR